MTGTALLLKWCWINPTETPGPGSHLRQGVTATPARCKLHQSRSRILSGWTSGPKACWPPETIERATAASGRPSSGNGL